MRQCQPRARNLPLATLVAQLYAGLNDSKESVHSGVTTRQPSAIGIHRQSSTRPDTTTGHELPTFPLGAETQVLQKQQGVDSESVVQLNNVNILRLHASQGIGTLPRFTSSGYRQVSRLIHAGIPGCRRGRQYIYGSLDQISSTLGAGEYNGRCPISDQTAIGHTQRIGYHARVQAILDCQILTL